MIALVLLIVMLIESVLYLYIVKIKYRGNWSEYKEEVFVEGTFAWSYFIPGQIRQIMFFYFFMARIFE